MPGLIDSSKESDIKMFEEMFSNSDFRPDALKIYPCMVIGGTKLNELYKKNKFRPLETNEAAEIISEAKKYVPKYARIMRIQRDIPTKAIIAGVGETNLRQRVSMLMAKKGIKCKCIRCNEPKGESIDVDNLKILNMEYEASNGTEVFISSEDVKKNILAGFCRLRMPYKPFRKEITSNSAGIRELHVYGSAVNIGKQGNAIQHKGIGKELVEEAEKIAAEKFGANKIIVISGVGARQYFYEKGYRKDGPYVSKRVK